MEQRIQQDGGGPEIEPAPKEVNLGAGSFRVSDENEAELEEKKQLLRRRLAGKVSLLDISMISTELKTPIQFLTARYCSMEPPYGTLFNQIDVSVTYHLADPLGLLSSYLPCLWNLTWL